MRRFLAAIVVLTICALVTPPVRATQLAYAPLSGRDGFVAIEPLAKELGWTFRRTDGGALLDDGSGPQLVRVGSRLVREDGADLALFEQPPVVRNGQIELAAADAATLFHLETERDGARIAFVAQPAGGLDVREIPRPAMPAPGAPATPQPQAYVPPALVTGNAGTLSVAVQFDGGNRTYQTSLSGNAGLVRGAVSSYGDTALTNPVGAVTVGAPARNVAFGSVENPLAGSVIGNGSLIGADAHVATHAANYDLSSGRTFTANVTSLARSTAGETDALAYVSGTGGFDQAILRHAVESKTPWGALEYETLAGERGTGVGLHARTSGATFLDATFSAASGALPVTAGDLPTGAVLGRHLGPVTTISAGFVRSIAAPGSPTLGASTRWNNLNLAANVSAHWTNVSASYAGAGGYAQFFASSGAARVFGANAGFAVHRAQAELDLSSSGGSTSGIAQLRTNHAGLNLAGGFDLSDGRVKPLAGIVAPLAPSLALEVGIVAGASGRPALRIAMLAGFRAPKPRVAMFPVTVFVPDAQRFGALRVFVDGAPAPAPFVPGAKLMLPAGRHTLFVESADRAYRSSSLDVLAGAATNVDAALLPQRTVAGRVRFDASAGSVPPDVSLEGIRVVIEPSGESATTGAGGAFAFARGAYDPASTLLLDPATVPAGYDAPPVSPVVSGAAEITLVPRRAVEHTTFR